MKRLLLLLLAIEAWGQAPVTAQFGALYCAAIQRPNNQVQSWCYGWPGPPWRLIHNQIDNTPIQVDVDFPAAGFTPPVTSDAVMVWRFGSDGTYQYTTDQSQNITSGTFGGVATTVHTEILGLSCPVSMEPGAIEDCICTLNQAVLTPFDIALGIPAPLIGPSVVSVLAGSSTVIFSVQYLEVTPPSVGDVIFDPLVALYAGPLFPLSLNMAEIDLLWLPSTDCCLSACPLWISPGVVSTGPCCPCGSATGTMIDLIRSAQNG